ncbi:TetR family transcriptional regulator [Pseudoclavibacter chungangensis]|uniref:TetR family transcriptional regulator n=2 Tax=Pseudoclavibacter chungangensis TaxID=587635 RepID=A0A7J5BUS2_9MICO|nr:TetR family transcriptional regulator [Pseudoclavibacter chungangensis]
MLRSSRGPREIARMAVRAHVIDVAIGLFVDNGYDETTIDTICDEAGISRSTFFRLFPGKAALVASNATRFGERVADALAERPDGEPIWDSLRRALDPLVDAYATQPRAFELARLAADLPVVGAREHDKLGEWIELLRLEVARRIGVDVRDDADPRADAIIAAMVGAIHTSMTYWARSAGERSLSALLDAAMSPLGGGAPGPNVGHVPASIAGRGSAPDRSRSL